MAVKTYDPKKVFITLGNHLVSGYADDSFISIEPNGDGITHQVGCDGEIARSISPDWTCKVKLSLLQTGESNAWLQNMFDNDRTTGDGLFSILIKDMRGNLVVSADTAWIVKSATRAFGKATNNREWEINTGSSTITED